MTDSAGLTTSGIIGKALYGLAPADVQALRDVAALQTYPAGTLLCRQGEVEHLFYILAEGTAELYQTLVNGEEHVLGLKRAGEFFGEMALIEDAPRTASVRAATTVSVLEIDEAVFDAVIARSPALALGIARTMSQNLRENDARAIRDLEEKNLELQRQNTLLEQAYHDLKEAQSRLVANEVMLHDVETAVAVQRGLLPREIPTFRGLRFGGLNIPARDMGGDLYDVFWLDGEHVGLLMADVSDKSIHAALYMAITKTLFQTSAKHVESPAEVAQLAHRGLLDVSYSDDMFVTAFYGVLNCRTGKLRYANAGHERTILLRQGEAHVQFLPGVGRFLGMMEGLHLSDHEINLASGDLLVLYSDGVPDMIDAQRRRFGRERLAALVVELREATPQQIVAGIVEALRAHQGSARQYDDLTLLAISVAPETQFEPDAEGLPG